MLRRPSLLRRCLALLGVALLTAAWAVGISTPASAAPARASLDVTSIVDTTSGLGGPVQGRPFNVTVRVLDSAGAPTTVTQTTTVVLEEVSGPGVLGGTTTAVIPRGGSGATISGATYSKFANGVALRVRATSGAKLAPKDVVVDVALTAVGTTASPRQSKTVTDPNCGAPTAAVPNCGELLLPNGANGRVTLSVASCDGLCPTRDDRTIQALVVTAIATLKDNNGNPLYTGLEHATLIIACDKDLCRETANGVPRIPVYYTPDNTGPLTKVAPPCPDKGVLGDGQEACVDYVSSSRQQGDLYMYLLWNIDMRGSM
jgi:hypothetical protein